MTKIVVRTIGDIQEWEGFLGNHVEANFLQSWYWGEFNRRLGKSVQMSGFYKGKKLVGVMLSVVENARRGRYLTVAGGPILDWDDEGLVAAAFLEMRRIGKETGSVFVRIRPQLREGGREIFKRYGCVDAQMHLHAELSNILDISVPEDELLAQMRKTTRYEIKKGLKEGVRVEVSKDEGLIKEFYDLQIETARRQRFVPFSYLYLKEQMKVFFEEGKGLLYRATYEGRMLAQAFVIFYGQEADYHYGASTEEGRKYPGAYLLQWEAILEAKRRGMSRYNFWGVAPEGEEDHRFYGVSVFKRGFGGEDVGYLHAQDLVIDRMRYLGVYLIERVRKKLRKV
jgi:lipid II:glycine glycyltransferase (peptidoglycan interpeptide bridge formation enzyme)